MVQYRNMRIDADVDLYGTTAPRIIVLLELEVNTTSLHHTSGCKFYHVTSRILLLQQQYML